MCQLACTYCSHIIGKGLTDENVEDCYAMCHNANIAGDLAPISSNNLSGRPERDRVPSYSIVNLAWI